MSIRASFVIILCFLLSCGSGFHAVVHRVDSRRVYLSTFLSSKFRDSNVNLRLSRCSDRSSREDTLSHIAEGNDKIRTATYSLIWIAFVLYAAFLSPGHDSASQAADKFFMQSYMTSILSSDLNPIFLYIFNSFGIVIVSYWQLLLPGSNNQKPLPTAPFAFGALAFGFFLLGPYLAFREYKPNLSTESSISFKFLASRTAGFLTLAVAVGLTTVFIQSNPLASWDSFKDLVGSSTLANVTCVDYTILSLAIWEPILEDMRRRGMYDNKKLSHKLKLALYVAIPVIGPAFYLCTRKDLCANDKV